MKLPKMDFGKIAKESAGNFLGLVVTKKVMDIKQIAEIKKPTTKGLAIFGIGKILLPMIANMAGLKDKKTMDFVNGASESMATVGLMYVASGNDATKDLVPAISGYEEQPYRSLGLIEEEDNTGVNGTDPYRDLSE
jgi:hypothetical protein